MSDNILSQEEIEALFRGDVGGEEDNASPSELADDDLNDLLTDMEKDTLGEIGNMSFGSAATALSALLGQKVEITTPTTTVVSRESLESEFIQPYVAVKVEYTAGLTGANLLVIKKTDAAIIADLMLGGDGTKPDQELNDIHLSAVQEAMNQMMGSAATSMSTIFNKKVDISPPTTDIMDIQNEKGIQLIPQNGKIIKVSFNIKVGELIDSDIMQLFEMNFGKGLVAELEHVMSGGPSKTMKEEMPSVNFSTPLEQPTLESKPYLNQTPIQQVPNSQQQRQQQVNIQQPQFASFDTPQLNKDEHHNLNLLLDIPLEVTVELGRTTRSVKEILEMSSGSIIELDKLAGEPVDILVNNRNIAKGEVVVIDENFGVRITDILNKEDRLNNLR